MPVPGKSRFPFLVRLTVALTLFNSWVLFEEIVVDRLGWWRYMPCYRVGRFCEWDVLAILVISLVTAVSFSGDRSLLVQRLRRSCGSFGCRFCRAPIR
jgi:hypothetical protein